MLNAIARTEGCDGEEADASGAYIQAELEGPETWVTLPKNRQPASWAGIKDPVVPLLRNLYGHPLAGLIWDKGSQVRNTVLDMSGEVQNRAPI